MVYNRQPLHVLDTNERLEQQLRPKLACLCVGERLHIAMPNLNTVDMKGSSAIGVITIQREMHTWLVHDNLNGDTHQSIVFITATETIEHIDDLWQLDNLLDYAQERRVREFKTRFGCDVLIQYDNRPPLRAQILHFRVARPDYVEQSQNKLNEDLYYIPYNKSGELGNVHARKVYAGANITPM